MTGFAKITKDHLTDDLIPTHVGFQIGTRESHADDGDLMKFRLLDDDRIPYYEGLCDDEGMDEIFDWSMADSGTTILQLWDEIGGQWRDTLS